jgi:hypothetical protein
VWNSVLCSGGLWLPENEAQNFAAGFALSDPTNMLPARAVFFRWAAALPVLREASAPVPELVHDELVHDVESIDAAAPA